MLVGAARCRSSENGGHYAQIQRHPTDPACRGRAARCLQSLPTDVPIEPVTNALLINLIVKARRWWAELRRGEIDIKRLAEREGVQAPYLTRVLRLEFLAPAVIDAILAGRQSGIATVTELTLGRGAPAHWHEQAAQLLPGGLK